MLASLNERSSEWCEDGALFLGDAEQGRGEILYLRLRVVNLLLSSVLFAGNQGGAQILACALNHSHEGYDSVMLLNARA